ncbi:DUF3021 family protein [Paenibacillus sp. GSMTC-2017]|uniref:DUF3021 family protein n=1 Tax=Paenibacillus sp. GSMTC-2017 TaxID=2794350 RepID=UPI0018D5BD4E|nr:DUF3021 family protein [Paenibacillus sp. GSMTC-2017]MBH5319564.1 DUF3021 family protein [Paenibacillus sp. GSMTC-2017]
MKLSQYVWKIINDFFIIFASLILIITLLRQIFYPELAFDLHSIYILMTFSLISAITGFILYSPNDISENNMRKRIVIHFIALEVIIISLGSIIGILNSVLSMVTCAIQIAIIYIIVRLLSWQNDKQIANSINEKLKDFQKNL